MIIDPDRFLETPQGRLWTPERNRDAWAAAFEALEAALAAAPPPAQVIVVCGIQGAGKSTWSARANRQQPTDIIFDAALPGRRHRAPIITAARRWRARVAAIWIDTPLDLALQRNAARAADRIVPEATLRGVAERFEPPNLDDDFDALLVVRP